jgi:hypothetical protein
VHQTAKLCYSGNVLMENRNGLVVDVMVVPADGRAERQTALQMLRRQGSQHEERDTRPSRAEASA